MISRREDISKVRRLVSAVLSDREKRDHHDALRALG